eukprot:COSAG02_NODE_2503_length_8671_cov_20.133108_9_plen_563_part_00
MAAAATGLPARAKSLFMRAEVAEAAGELNEALKLYDQGVREATSSLRGNPGDTTSAIAAVDGYFRRAMVLKARIRDGEVRRQPGQKAASERTISPGRGGVRRQQQPRRQGPEVTDVATNSSVAERPDSTEVNLQAERQETARLRDELALARSKLAEANSDLARANGGPRQQGAVHAAPPDSPPQAGADPARSQDDALDPGSDDTRLEQCEARLNAAVMAEEVALDALTGAAQELVDAKPGEKGLFMRLQCAGWVVCRTSQSGTWDRLWLAVTGDIAELRNAPPSADSDGTGSVEGGDRAQGTRPPESAAVATVSLQACGVTRHGADRLRLTLPGADAGIGNSSSNLEWHFSPAADASSIAVDERLAAWVVVLEAGSRYNAGVAAHRDLRLSQAADMCSQASELLSKGDAAAAAQLFRHSSEAITDLGAVETGGVRRDLSEAMELAERGLALAEDAMAAEVGRANEKVAAAIAPYREELVARCTEIARESAAEAVQEATRRVELWRERAQKAEDDLSASQDAVAQLELEVSKLRTSSAATASVHHRSRPPTERRGGGCCGSKP